MLFIAVLHFRGHLVLLRRGDFPPGTPTLHWMPQLRLPISRASCFFLRVGARVILQHRVPSADTPAVIISKLLRDAAAESVILFSSHRHRCRRQYFLPPFDSTPLASTPDLNSIKVALLSSSLPSLPCLQLPGLCTHVGVLLVCVLFS